MVVSVKNRTAKLTELTNVDTQIITILELVTELNKPILSRSDRFFYPTIPRRAAPTRSHPTWVWLDKIEKSLPFPPESRHCCCRLQGLPKAGLGAPLRWSHGGCPHGTPLASLSFIEFSAAASCCVPSSSFRFYN